MENITCQVSPNENCKSERLSVELIFRTSLLDNVTHWKVFEGDYQILHFLQCEKTFKNMVIYEGDNDEEIKKPMGCRIVGERVVC